MKKQTVAILIALLFAACDKKSTIKITNSSGGVSFSSGKTSLAPFFRYANKEHKLRSNKIMKWVKMEQKNFNRKSI